MTTSAVRSPLDGEALVETGASAEESGRLWRAIVLSPDVETCAALLRGEDVPIDRLDEAWLRRFGIEER